MLLLRLLLHCTAGVAFVVGSSDATLRLRPLSPALGFEVSGPVVEAVRSGRARALLRRAFAASHGLLVFRGLESWQKEDMLALSGIFGLVEHGDVFRQAADLGRKALRGPGSASSTGGGEKPK